MSFLTKLESLFKSSAGMPQNLVDDVVAEVEGHITDLREEITTLKADREILLARMSVFEKQISDLTRELAPVGGLAPVSSASGPMNAAPAASIADPVAGTATTAAPAAPTPAADPAPAAPEQPAAQATAA